VAVLFPAASWRGVEDFAQGIVAKVFGTKLSDSVLIYRPAWATG